MADIERQKLVRAITDAKADQKQRYKEWKEALGAVYRDAEKAERIFRKHAAKQGGKKVLQLMNRASTGWRFGQKNPKDMRPHQGMETIARQTSEVYQAQTGITKAERALIDYDHVKARKNQLGVDGKPQVEVDRKDGRPDRPTDSKSNQPAKKKSLLESLDKRVAEIRKSRSKDRGFKKRRSYDQERDR